MRLVITLVHGTWARKASWTTQGSRLRNKLQSELPEGSLINTFEWSGSNLPVHREEAAQKLRAFVRASLKDHAGSRHVIIAHSHGGNVALRAVEDLDQEVAVACLSTPFFQSRNRNLGRLAATALRTAERVIYVSLVLLLIPLLSRRPWIHVLGLAAGITAATFGWIYFRHFLFEKAKQAGLSLAVRVSPKRQLLLIRTIGDEATAALSSFQFVSWTLTRFFIIGVRYASRFWERDQELGAGVKAVLLQFPQFCLITILSPLVFLWVLLMGLIFFPLGPGMFLSSLLFDVTIESSPVGSWTVHLFPAPTAGSADTTKQIGLVHSASYEDVEALDMLTRWIRGIANGVRSKEETSEGDSGRDEVRRKSSGV